MTRWRAASALAAGLWLAAGATSPAAAQISPGPLSAAHRTLEGPNNCLTCHRAGEGVAARLCLDCHRELDARVAAGQGLHASPDYAACERCHPEHGGVEFELVDWPGGRDAFDHALGGWKLEGKHAPLACEKCHRRERIAAEVVALAPARRFEHSYVGLSPTCSACHDDPHRGTLKAGACSECHSQESWKNQTGFEHSRTRLPLREAHARATCVRCHAPEGADAKTLVFSQYRDRPSAPACADCHRDPHRGRLGADCASCHNERSFREASSRGFDHDRTAYPLRGRHRGVDCARCHAAGSGLRIAGFERCESCHRDPHLGQLRQAAAGGACADCHSVDGFRPARFGIDEHARARFPLAGAHRAVPCDACHREVAAGELALPFRGAAGARVHRYRYDSFACLDCHRDPHGGELDRYADGRSCLACHDQERWRGARFDHERARFGLRGAHARVECAKCHPPSGDASRRFSGRPLDCAGCHRDVHAGQFAAPGGVTDCARCHGLERFRPAPGFDHARSRFVLDGRHAGVECAKCHPSEATAAGPLVRYRPRPLECSGCHLVAGEPATAQRGAR